jgi:hypothetical protein
LDGWRDKGTVYTHHHIQGAAEFGKLIKTKPSKIKIRNYITQVAAFIVDTLIEPLLVTLPVISG